MNNLVACCFLRNEARYLLEWVFFHKLQGVEFFYFYEGNSTDNTRGILTALEKAGLATVHSDPKYTVPYQMGCYNEYIATHLKESCWTAFIDTDEFIFSPRGQLLPVINQCSGAALAVHWVMYGSSSFVNYDPNKLVIERFTERAHEVNEHVKSICYNNELVSASGNPHAFKLSDRATDENGVILDVEYAISPNATADQIRINHYHLKSKVEHIERKIHIDPIEKIEHSFAVHDKNEIEDPILVPQANAVRSMIAQFTYG